MGVESSRATSAAGTRADVAILSDDINLAAMLQHALALSPEPRFRIEIVSPANFDGAVYSQNDLVFLDRVYRARPYTDSLVAQSADCRALVVLLLDERELGHDLGGFAAAVKRGVDAMLLRSEVSLQRILDLLASSRPVHTTGAVQAQGATAGNAAAREMTGSPGIAAPAASTAQTASPAATELYQHSLAIDLESQRIHIASQSNSPLFDEADTLLSLQDWTAKLDARGGAEFTAMLRNAADYRSIPRQIQCEVSSDSGIFLPSTIEDIQIKNDGQGRVVGASAELHVLAPRNEANAAPRAGFDNLFDPAGDSTELLAAQQSWENIARSLPMMCVLLDENGFIAQVVNNEEHLRQHFPRAQVGHRLSDILEIESLDNLVETIARTLNTGKSHQQTVAYASKEGMRWLDTHVTKLKGDAGLSRQVVWTAFDVTSTRHSYQELLKAHDELFQLLDDAPLLFFQKDSQGRFQRANKTFCEHYGVRADVISGRQDEEVFRDSAAEFCGFGRHVSQSLLQNAGQLSNYSYVEERGGATRRIFWQAIPITQGGKAQVDGYAGFGFIADDMTLAGSAESSARAGFDSEEPILSLSGAVGRDFNAILNAIVQYTEMAIAQKNQAREQRIADHLEEVLKTASHAHELVAHKASRKKEKKETEGTLLQPLIEEVIAMMRPTMPATLNLQTQIDQKAPAALIAETPFKQIVLQLLVSARNTAIAAQNEQKPGDDQEILLTLSQDKLPSSECSACENKVSGDYIVLAVHTRTADVSSVDLQKLIVAARSATRKNAPENVVAMAHNNNGHAIIEQQDKSLALQLLFQKA